MLDAALGIIIIACVSVAATGVIFRIIRGMEILEKLTHQADQTAKILDRITRKTENS